MKTPLRNLRAVKGSVCIAYLRILFPSSSRNISRTSPMNAQGNVLCREYGATTDDLQEGATSTMTNKQTSAHEEYLVKQNQYAHTLCCNWILRTQCIYEHVHTCCIEQRFWQSKRYRQIHIPMYCRVCKGEVNIHVSITNVIISTTMYCYGKCYH